MNKYIHTNYRTKTKAGANDRRRTTNIIHVYITHSTVVYCFSTFFIIRRLYKYAIIIILTAGQLSICIKTVQN